LKVLRERDGIPDLRRAARFRYASVNLPEVDGSIRKLLKSGRDLDDTLIAAVIRNLKIVQDRSKVIVMDADGTRSKGIARSLRNLGIKKPYLVQGGFQSWAKQGLRIKELKLETTLAVLNEVFFSLPLLTLLTSSKCLKRYNILLSTFFPFSICLV
jgi:rhodanese-related sulfurtransferase